MSAKNGQIKNCETCGHQMYVKKSLLKRKRFCSRSCLGKKTDLAIGLIPRNKKAWNKGKKLHYSVWNKGLKGFMQGDKNANWKGGKTSLSDKIRTCFEYKQWRKKVFDRDNYTCTECGRYRKKGDRVILNADHIKPLALIIANNCITTPQDAIDCPEMWDIKNGRCLCRECHKMTKTFGINFIRWKKTEYVKI